MNADLSVTILRRARAGDEEAFRVLTDPHRRELQVHCYRILGSVQDAEDMVQEALLGAGAGSAGSRAGRPCSWLYRIATSRCLNALRDSGRRPRNVLGSDLPGRPAGASRSTPSSPY